MRDYPLNVIAQQFPLSRLPGLKAIALPLAYLALLTACAQSPEGVALEEIDPNQRIIFHNGTVLTMEKDRPIAEAIALRGEVIAAVGSNEEILALQDSGVTVIDLDGRTVMPGFVDAHTHILNDHRSEGMSLDQAQQSALRNGITSLGTLYVDESFLNDILEFHNEGFLRVRTSLYLVQTDPCGNVIGDWWKEYPLSRDVGAMLQIAGVKIFTDGGSCGRVALSFELEPGQGNGDLWYSQEELNQMVAEVHKAGYQAAIHAIGDRAVEQTLNAIEATLNGASNELRHRMEHASMIPADQIPRFGQLGVVPVLNGQYPNCSPFGPPIPEGYRDMEWPWRDLRTQNPDLAIAWHSDVPFLSGNPFVHLSGFVTRVDRSGQRICPPEEWLRDDTLTVDQALSIMTIQSAFALSRDDEVGSLVPGKYADLIVVANNPLGVDPTRITDNRVLLTMVGGRTEYCRSTDTDLCPAYVTRDIVTLPDTRPPVAIAYFAASMLIVIPVAAMLMRKRRTRAIHLIGGVAGLVAGAFWITVLLTNQLGEGSEEPPLAVIMIAASFMALGSAGLGTRWRKGRIGLAGLWVSLIGAVLFSEAIPASEWFLLDWGWYMFFVGMLIHMLGITVFGFANLKARVFNRLDWVPLMAGVAGGLVPFGLIFVVGDDADLPFDWLIAGMGVGWLAMSLLLLLPLPKAE